MHPQPVRPRLRRLAPISALCTLLTLCVCPIIPPSSAHQRRGTENIRWATARASQQELWLAAEAAGVPLSIRLSVKWDELKAEQERLYGLAGQLDEEEARIEAETRKLAAEALTLGNEREQIDREWLISLKPAYDELKPAYLALLDEHNWIERESARLFAAQASAKDPSVYNPEVISLQERAGRYTERQNTHNGLWNNWKAREDVLRSRADSFESRRTDFNTRLAAFDQSINDFNARVRGEYDGPVTHWQQAVEELFTLQQGERERVRQEMARNSAGARVPAPEPPKPRLDSESAPGAVLTPSTVKKLETAVDVIGFGAAVAGVTLSAPATTILLIGQSSYAALKGAERAEENKLRADMDRIRRLPDVIRNIDAYGRALEDSIARGEITRERKRELMGERARELVSNLPGSGPDDGHRFRDNFLGTEAGFEIATTVGAWGVGNVAGKLVGPVKDGGKVLRPGSIGNVTPEKYKKFLEAGGKRSKSLGDSTAFFQWSSQKTVTEYTKSVRELKESEAAKGADELKLKGTQQQNEP